MTMDRRRWLGLSASFGMASLTSSLLSACASTGAAGSGPAAAVAPVALLLPLSGASADLGRSMERAAALTQPAGEGSSAFIVLDTGGSAEGAGAAAAQAVQQGAAMILGPLFTREVTAVVAAAAGRPVLTLSNDTAASTAGAFVLGVTPSQGTTAVLAYARDRGVRRVAVVAGSDPWGQQSAVGAREAAPRVGVELIELDRSRLMAAGDNLAAGLTAAGGGRMPHAVLLTDEGPEAAVIGRRLMAEGVQILGPSRWSDDPVSVLDGLEGAWLAASDPSAFSAFARTYEDVHKAQPGALAALTYDAATIARRLQAAGRVSREGLATPEGFQGTLGAVRFSSNGRCTREMAIMVVERGELRVVARAAGA